MIWALRQGFSAGQVRGAAHFMTPTYRQLRNRCVLVAVVALLLVGPRCIGAESGICRHSGGWASADGCEWPAGRAFARATEGDGQAGRGGPPGGAAGPAGQPPKPEGEGKKEGEGEKKEEAATTVKRPDKPPRSPTRASSKSTSTTKVACRRSISSGSLGRMCCSGWRRSRSAASTGRSCRTTI